MTHGLKLPSRSRYCHAMEPVTGAISRIVEQHRKHREAFEIIRTVIRETGLEISIFSCDGSVNVSPNMSLDRFRIFQERRKSAISAHENLLVRNFFLKLDERMLELKAALSAFVSGPEFRMALQVRPYKKGNFRAVFTSASVEGNAITALQVSPETAMIRIARVLDGYLDALDMTAPNDFPYLTKDLEVSIRVTDTSFRRGQLSEKTHDYLSRGATVAMHSHKQAIAFYEVWRRAFLDLPDDAEIIGENNRSDIVIRAEIRAGLT